MTKTWRSTTRGFSTPFAAFSQHYAADSKPLLVNFFFFYKHVLVVKLATPFKTCFRMNFPIDHLAARFIDLSKACHGGRWRVIGRRHCQTSFEAPTSGIKALSS